MNENNRNELIDLFGRLFGEAVAKEIGKYESRKVDESKYSEDVRILKGIIEKAVEDSTERVLSEITRTKQEILDRLYEIEQKVGNGGTDTIGPIRPWTTPYYPYTPNPLDPLGPVITYTGDPPPVLETHTYSVGSCDDSITLSLPELIGSIVAM